MADKKLTELIQATVINNSDKMYLAQSDVSKQTSVELLLSKTSKYPIEILVADATTKLTNSKKGDRYYFKDAGTVLGVEVNIDDILECIEDVTGAPTDLTKFIHIVAGKNISSSTTFSQVDSYELLGTDANGNVAKSNIYAESNHSGSKNNIIVDGNIRGDGHLNLGGGFDIVSQGTEIGVNNKITQENFTMVKAPITTNEVKIVKIPTPSTASTYTVLQPNDADQLPANVSYTYVTTSNTIMRSTSFKLYAPSQNLRFKIEDSVTGEIYVVYPSIRNYDKGEGVSLSVGDHELTFDSPIYIPDESSIRVTSISDNACLLGDLTSGVPYTKLLLQDFTYRIMDSSGIEVGLIESDSPYTARLNSTIRIAFSSPTTSNIFSIVIPKGSETGDKIAIKRPVNVGTSGNMLEFTIDDPENATQFVVFDSNGIPQFDTTFTWASSGSSVNKITLFWNDDRWEIEYGN